MLSKLTRTSVHVSDVGFTRWWTAAGPGGRPRSSVRERRPGVPAGVADLKSARDRHVILKRISVLSRGRVPPVHRHEIAGTHYVRHMQHWSRRVARTPSVTLERKITRETSPAFHRPGVELLHWANSPPSPEPKQKSCHPQVEEVYLLGDGESKLGASSRARRPGSTALSWDAVVPVDMRVGPATSAVDVVPTPCGSGAKRQTGRPRQFTGCSLDGATAHAEPAGRRGSVEGERGFQVRLSVGAARSTGRSVPRTGRIAPSRTIKVVQPRRSGYGRRQSAPTTSLLLSAAVPWQGAKPHGRTGGWVEQLPFRVAERSVRRTARESCSACRERQAKRTVVVDRKVVPGLACAE
jgi:hypothetical protein